MLNFTVSRPVHIVLMAVALILSGIVLLAAKGEVAIQAPVLTIIGYVLSTINSIDPTTVAKTLPSATLARLTDAKKLSESQRPPPPQAA